MSWEEFWFVLVGCVLAMWACRVIPPAAFAALVANDLLNPGMFDAGVWPAAIPLVAAVASALVAVKTKSLLWTAVAGVAVYAALAFFAV